MQRRIRFPIKGTYYYAAELAIDMDLLQLGSHLQLRFEPENLYDANAIQIWLNNSDDKALFNSDSEKSEQGYLLGYVPKSMSRELNKQLHHYSAYSLDVINLAKFGKSIEIDCVLQLEQPLLPFIYLNLLATLSRNVMTFKRWKRRFFSHH